MPQDAPKPRRHKQSTRVGSSFRWREMETDKERDLFHYVLDPCIGSAAHGGAAIVLTPTARCLGLKIHV